MREHSVKSAYIYFILVNFAVYGLNGIYYSFIQQYVLSYQSPVPAGYLLAVGPAVTILAPLFWGWAADKSKFKNTVMAITVVGGAVSMCALGLNHSFVYMFAVLFVIMFFIAPFGSLVDTVSLEYANEHGMAYGLLRVMGTIAFGVMSLVVSAFYETNENSMFIAYAALAVPAVAFILLAPKVRGHAKKKEKYSLRPIFADRTLMGYFAVTAVSQFAWGCYLNAFPSYLTTTLGLGQWVWGVNVMVTVAGEIPFFLMFDRIFKRFGARKVLLCGAVLTAVRYVALAYAAAPLPILATALLTGLSPTVLLYVAAKHISTNVPEELRASGQNVMYALTFGLPRVIAGVLGGYLSESFGTRGVLLLCAAVGTLAVVVYLAATGRKTGRNKADG